jgi:hypothetical protein
VVDAATADEVEAEIRAQIAHARRLGIAPTHVDSHMGTLFATPEFLRRYVSVAIAEKIPAMLPAGHNTLLLRQTRAEGGDVDGRREALLRGLGRELGQAMWEAGLPVIDDLHNMSYGWHPPTDASDDEMREFKVQRYVAAMRELEPGITMMINHASDAGEHFSAISKSGPTRRGDLLALQDPRVRAAVEEQGIVLTTWRELSARRAEFGAPPGAVRTGE